MYPIQAAGMGLIEGLSEFLPISSTFHMILASRFMGLWETETLKLFQVFIQSGAILAVLFLYWRDFFNKKIFKHLILSFLPTAIIGFVLHDFVKNSLFGAFFWQLTVFFVVGVLFLLVDRSKDTVLKHLNNYEAIIIGIVQSVAILPGVSRAGAVMVAMLLLGYNRRESARYSFLLAVPTIMAAGLWDVYKNRGILLTPGLIPNLALGSLVAFVSAIILLPRFMKFNEKYGLWPWGWYRIVVATFCFVLGLK